MKLTWLESEKRRMLPLTKLRERLALLAYRRAKKVDACADRAALAAGAGK